MIDYRKEYGKAAPAFDEAVEILKASVDPIGKILNSSAYWLPLQFLYREMVKNKDLVGLRDLTTDKKEYYWQMVKRFDWPQWKKISVMQAVYVWENIRQ